MENSARMSTDVDVVKPVGSNLPELSIYADLDINFYKDLYPDMRDKSDEEIFEHWQVQGKAESRYPNADLAYSEVCKEGSLPTEFDPKSYRKLNPDLNNIVNFDFQAAEHYLLYGNKEGRLYSKISLEIKKKNDEKRKEKIDFDFYRLYYTDMSSQSDEYILEHWVEQGHKEERFSSAEKALSTLLSDSRVPNDFDPKEYLKLNVDLQKTNTWLFEAVHHFVNFGLAEGRVYKVQKSHVDDEKKSKNPKILEDEGNDKLDCDFYQYQYPDLSNLTSEMCRIHWENTGKSESRSPNFSHFLSKHMPGYKLPVQFNVPSYLSKNQDLVGQFSSYWDCAKHFVNTGYKELRAYKASHVDHRFVSEYYGVKLPKNQSTKACLEFLRKRVGNELDINVYLNEAEFVHSHGFPRAAFLSIFDHEAYIYSNSLITSVLMDCNRAQCLAHYVEHGIHDGLNISYDYTFNAEFYYNEYKLELKNILSDLDLSDIDESIDDPLSECLTLESELYEHWIHYGIHEGKHPNLKAWLKAEKNLILPAIIEKNIRAYYLANRDSINSDKLTVMLLHYIHVGLNEDRVGVLHREDCASFYCQIADIEISSGEREKGIKVYEQVLKNNTLYPHAMHHLADQLLRDKYYGSAYNLYNSLVESRNATQWVYLNLAECQKHLSDYENAAKTLKIAAKQFPADIYINDRSKELVRLNFAKAMDCARRCAESSQVKQGKLKIKNALSLFEVEHCKEKRMNASRHIAIIGNHDLAQCKFYRIDQKIEQLREAGYVTSVYKHTESLSGFHSSIYDFAAVIFYRVPSIPEVVDAINASNSRGIPTIYDVDDLIFDEQLFPPPFETYAGQISQNIHNQLAVDVPLLAHAMSMCQYGIASTNTLADHMARFIRSGDVAVHKNSFSKLHEKYARKETYDRQSDVVTVFYGSGTKAHKDDFHSLLEPAFSKLHDKYKDKVRFLVIGDIEKTESLSKLGEQLVLIEPIWDIEQYWNVLRDEADINLAVLSSNPVTDSKSEIKWLEAAMLGIPSLVSETASYNDVIVHKETGLICKNSDDFYENLDWLIQDKKQRKLIGSNAKKHVKQHYSLATQAKSIDKIISRFCEREKSKKIKVAIVNVFYPPEAIGGATRVVHDNVQNLIQHYGDTFEIQVFCSSSGNNPYEPRVYTENGIKVTTVNSPSVPDVDHRMTDSGMGIAFARFLAEYNPDVVHFHCIQRLTESIVTETRRRDIPYVITAHDGWWVSDRQFLVNEQDMIELYDYTKNSLFDNNGIPLRQRILHNELKGAYSVLAVSKPFADIYTKAGVEHVQVVENGVSDIENLEKSAGSKKVRLAHLGGTERHKGLHVIKNVLMSSPELTHLELLVIDHAASPGSIRTEVWGSTVVTFKPKQEQSSVAQLYKDIDVLIAPSIWPESFGLVTREALLCGCWVVASDRGAVGSCIENGINGFVVTVDSTNPMKEAIGIINEDPKKFKMPPKLQSELRSCLDQAHDLANIYKRASVNQKLTVVDNNMSKPPLAPAYCADKTVMELKAG